MMLGTLKSSFNTQRSVFKELNKLNTSHKVSTETFIFKCLVILLSSFENITLRRHVKGQTDKQADR